MSGKAVERDARAATPDAAMPEESEQARRFEKARAAQAGALLEDYVELIDDLLQSGGEARPTDIARRLGVSHATAVKSIARLKREGLATARAYRGVFLTEQGRALALRARGASSPRRRSSDGRRRAARQRRTRRRGHGASRLRRRARGLLTLSQTLTRKLIGAGAAAPQS